MGCAFENHHLHILESMGMLKDDISPKMVLSRLKNIVSKDLSENRFERVNNLLKYLGEVSSKTGMRRFELIEQTDIETIPFLPPLEKPQYWPLKWKTTQQSLVTPKQLFVKECVPLVACTQHILDTSKIVVSSEITPVLTWLGVRGIQHVKLDEVVEQLLYVSSLDYPLKSQNELKIVSDVCHKIYHHLEKLCTETKLSDIDCTPPLTEKLIGKKVILIGNKMIEPGKIALSLHLPLEPYLYQLDSFFKIRYPNFLATIGIKQKFQVSDVRMVIDKVEQKQNGSRLAGDDLEFYCKCLQVLLHLTEDSCPIYDIKLPNQHGFLYESHMLCFDDCDWVNITEELQILHECISSSDGRRFGIKTKREASLSRCVSAIPFMKAFGPSEKLTSRLKRILEGYPFDICVLNELLQNADDAGATELKLIKDYRNHSTEKVFSDEWKPLQGPALCVFNNTSFSEADLEGIQNLGTGTKGLDPLKIGRYGVGFNVAYHFTDVPSFFSRGPAGKETLCVFDPHMAYVPKVVNNGSVSPGVRFTDLTVIQRDYTDIFSCYLHDSVFHQGPGTLFRFPLRTCEMAQRSEISTKEVMSEDIDRLLETLKEEVCQTLIFLTHVQKVSICKITSSGELETEYTIESTVDKTKSRDQLNLYSEHLLESNLENMDQMEVVMQKTIRDSEGNESNFLIVESVGFSCPKDLPLSVTKQWKHRNIISVPRGGVAIPLSVDRQNCFKGKIFNVLPLPIETGLPVHINGHFALDHEARRNLWRGIDDYRYTWNIQMIERIISPSYLSALLSLKEILFHGLTKHSDITLTLKRYHSMFPMVKDTDEHFGKMLVQSIYKRLGKGNYPLFPVIKCQQGYFLTKPMNAQFNMEIQWVQINGNFGNQGYFNTLARYTDSTSSVIYKRSEQDDKMKLTRILKDLGLKIVETPLSIKYELEKHKVTVKNTSPEEVVEYLKTEWVGTQSFPSPVERTLLRNTENVRLVTALCSQYSDYFAQLEGLPLMLTQSTELQTFSEQRPILITDVPLLFPNSSRQFLHKCLLQYYIYYNKTDKAVLKHLDIESISILLRKELDPSRFLTGSCILWTYHPNSKWLWDLLTLIHKIVSKIDPMEKEWIHRLEPLQKWALIPVTGINQDDCTRTSSERKYLFPFKDAFKVMSFHDCSNSLLSETLKKVSVPCLDEPSFCSVQEGMEISRSTDPLALCHRLTAKMTDPESMIKALSDISSNGDCLTFSDCVVILHYFNDNIKKLQRNTELLGKIPFFPTLTGRHIAPNLCKQAYALQDSFHEIPKNGMDELCSQSKITVFIFHSNYKELLSALNIEVLSVDTFYADIILPNFSKITTKGDREKHLIYIRDQILPMSYPNTDRIMQALKTIPFIETNDGSLHMASDFYSTLENPGDKSGSRRVLKTMCKETDFPPPPYNEPKWLVFLNKIGCRNTVSDEDFINFTQQVQNFSKQRLCEGILEKSKVLLDHFFRRQRNDRIFPQIEHIRFVTPFNLVEDAWDGTHLHNISKQKEEALHLVAFSEAVSPKYYHSVWSSNVMWSLDVDDLITRKAGPSMQKRLQRPPSAEAVKKHVKNTCCILKRKPRSFIEEIVEILKKTMADVYCMIQQHAEDGRFVEDIRHIPLLFIPDENEFVSPNEVVIDIPSSDTIDGYLYKAPVFYGNFHNLFQLLGAHCTPTPDVYATILVRIYERSGGAALSDTDMAAVHKILERMLTRLSPSDALQVPVVYMPNRQGVMTPSTNLVFIDNEYFFQRMKHKTLNYVCEMTMENPFSKTSLMKNLPEDKRPVFLSAIVTEHIAYDSQSEGFSCYSNKYEQMMTSIEFIKGIIRLCFHSAQERIFPLSADFAEEIQMCLQSTKIRKIDGLETELIYQDRIIQESRQPTVCFVQKYSQNTVKIYFNKTKTKKDLAINAIELAKAINNMCSGMIGKDTAVVKEMLDNNPEDMETILDGLKIMKFNYPVITDPVGPTIYPPVGTPIPRVFHCHLDSNFRCIREGEHVAYCTFDEYTDSTEEKPKYVVHFVYALVIKVEINDNPLLSRYLIEISEGQPIWESTSRIYPFKILETSFPEDIEEVKGNDLENAFVETDEHEWNIIKLRLLIVWSPLGNPDYIDICSHRQKCIQSVIQRLSNIPDHGKYSMTNLMEEASRRATQQPKRTEATTTTTQVWHHSLRTEAFPNVEEAQRWLRQAKADVDSATHCLDDQNDEHFHWICYKAHQAAEKGLKAVYFTVDSFQAHGLKEHNLKYIASLLNDKSLLKHARSLQDTVGWHTRMRYPDVTEGNRIPADEYKELRAREAVDLAQKICDVCEANIQMSESGRHE